MSPTVPFWGQNGTVQTSLLEAEVSYVVRPVEACGRRVNAGCGTAVKDRTGQVAAAMRLLVLVREIRKRLA
jgi:hypothetical protein